MRFRSVLASLVMPLALGACGDAATVSDATARSPDPLPFLATQPAGPASLEALFRGPLVVRDACVLIGEPGDYALPVWPDGASLARDGSGRLAVLDADGVTVAVEGEVFEMGGGYTAEFLPRDKVEPREDQLQRVEEWLGYPLPEACVGKDVYGIWVVGETQPVAS